VALLAEGYDVVVKDPVALFVEDGDAEGGVVATVTGSAADGGIANGSEEGDGLKSLHGVSPCARSLGTHCPEGREGALLPSRGKAALPSEEVSGVGTQRPLAGGGGQNPEGAAGEFFAQSRRAQLPAPQR
jgi:hypothetical protein